MIENNSQDIAGQIDRCIRTGMLDQIALLLAHYEGGDLNDHFQHAYELCLQQDNIQFFARFYLARKVAHRVLPEKALLLKAIVHSICIFDEDSLLKAPFRQLEIDVLKALYEMLVFSQLVDEFLNFYADLIITNARKVPQPDASTIMTAIHLVDRRLAAATDIDDELAAETARETIRELFSM